MGGAGVGGMGVYSIANYTIVYKKLNKTESPIFVLLCVLCFKRQPFRFSLYFTAAGVKCRVVAVKRLPVLHHSTD